VAIAAATDRAGNTDPTPAARTWTVPLAAGDLTRGKGWALKRTGKAYSGSYLQATRKGATLTRSVTGARRLALVVGRGRGHGSVNVYAGSRRLTTVKLTSSGTRTRQLIPVTTFARPFSGSVRIVVATSDRPVRVEGLGGATR
jgi:hypothetical protein